MLGWRRFSRTLGCCHMTRVRPRRVWLQICGSRPPGGLFPGVYVLSSRFYGKTWKDSTSQNTHSRLHTVMNILDYRKVLLVEIQAEYLFIGCSRFASQRLSSWRCLRTGDHPLFCSTFQFSVSLKWICLTFGSLPKCLHIRVPSSSTAEADPVR